ncbi:PQQ-binding-like beta-propeller repeat protein [Amycolatopsis sp. NPDC058986]|uniref:outer membrane protein assembly factor BamB family protein n=1 Tax=unclassified Amycolatopsis TaxID=2618356 RepID=UPI0036702371
MVAEQGSLPAGAVRELAARLAETLAAEAGTAHRGLNPSTVRMTPDGPRLDESPNPAASPDAEGDPGFLCPELILGRPATSASDVYSLGAVLCFAATGSAPFDFGEVTTAYQRAVAHQRIVHEEPDLAAVPDAGLRVLIGDCLAKDPAARPSAAVVVQRSAVAPSSSPSLEDVFAVPFAPPPTGLVPSTYDPPPQYAPPSFTPPSSAPPSYTPSVPAAKRGRWAWITALAGGLAVVLVAVIALLAWPGDPSSAPSPAQAGRAGFAWSVPGGQGGSFVSLWRTSSLVVVGTSNSGLAAYDVTTGAQRWTWKPPENGHELPLLCNMSPGTDGGVGAFTYGYFRDQPGIEDCDHLQTIEVDTGKTRWAQPVSLVLGTNADGFPDLTGGTALSIGNGVVSARYAGGNTRAHGGSDLLAADVATGQVRWKTDAGENPMPGGCQLSGHAQVLRGQVYALAQCDAGAAPELVMLGGVDSPTVIRVAPLDGCRAGISYKTLSGVLTGDTHHLVVGCHMSTAGAGTRLFTLGAGRHSLTPVEVSGVAVNAVGFEYGGARPPENMVLTKDTLYLLNGENSAVSARNNGVAAIDPDTGRMQWTSTVAGSTNVTLLAATESGVDFVADGGGQPALYTATGGGQPAKIRALNAEQAKAFPGSTVQPPQSARVGGYLVSGFPGSLSDNETVVGAMPAEGP